MSRALPLLVLLGGCIARKHQIERFASNPALMETVGHRMDRNAGIVFPAREALFLTGSHQLTVSDQTRGAVVIEGTDSQNVHGVRPKASWSSSNHRWYAALAFS